MNRQESDPGWQRLSSRMIWVDLAQSVLSSLPAVIAIWFTGLQPGVVWPLIILAVLGVVGAAADALRWLFTRFRVTDSHVEVKTGLLFRQHRSMRRERIRSVDMEAQLRHRLARLRVVEIGAGQQAATGESALKLDAVTIADAYALQSELSQFGDRRTNAEVDESTSVESTEPANASEYSEAPDSPDEPTQVLATFRPQWVGLNMFSVWGYVLLLGLVWGGSWLLSSVGIDAPGAVLGLADWQSIGWVGTALIGFVVASVLAALGLGVTYYLEFWDFSLTRVTGTDATFLRTRRGLLTTREVNRDERRLRGVELQEPLLTRWLKAADTRVITTGLNEWSMSDPAAILPRSPRTFAQMIAGEVLGGESNPFHQELLAHPRAALHRRLRWAGVLSLGVTGALGALVASELAAPATLWVIPVVWAVTLAGAVLAYHALGHTLVGDWLITRSGLINRTTAVLRRSAVSTVVVRESVFQRRLGLRTVACMTAAGQGGYQVVDVAADTAVDVARQAATGYLDPFLQPRKSDS